MKAELKVRCGNTCISTYVKSGARQHLNDLLYDNGIDYTNRPQSRIDIYIDDAINASKLSQVIRWLEFAYP